MTEDDLINAMFKLFMSKSERKTDFREIAKQTNPAFALDLAQAMIDAQALIVKKDEKDLLSLDNNKDLTDEQPQKVTKIYGESWIVIQNRLLNAISDLDLNERRLIMFLSPIVRKAVDIEPTQRTFVIRIQDFLDEYNIQSNRYYSELADSCSSLVNKAYVFWDFKKNKKHKHKVEVSWLTKAEYLEKTGEVHVDLHNDVVEMLTVFDKSNPFTKYQRQMIINLGTYGIILFELVASCMFQKQKKKSYTIEYLREKFNCIDSYLKIGDFKLYVLDKAIKDIEKHTPYRIKYTQSKRGRMVSEINFAFENIEEKSIENNNEIKQLTEKQANSFGKKLSNLTVANVVNLSHLAGAKSEQEFAEMLADILRNPSNHDEKVVQQVFKALKEHTDFKPTIRKSK